MLTQFRFILLTSAVLSVAFLSIVGCSLFQKERTPIDKLVAEAENAKPTLIGNSVTIDNNWNAMIYGFGLVIGLPGTGGDDSHTPHDKAVRDDMNREGVRNVRDLLASSQTAVVEVIGIMRPGIQAGERFDVQVKLPSDTNTRSLQGGMLMDTNLSEMASSGRDFSSGRTLARVKGPIMVDDPMATDTTNPSGLKTGTILGGATARESRPLSLVLKEKSPFMADRIAKAINYRFHFTAGQQMNVLSVEKVNGVSVSHNVAGPHKGIANAFNDSLITVHIHPTYANDVPRYIRVVQSIMCHETQIQQLKRIERLKEELKNPNTAQHAAFQLEAIGKLGISALQEALKSPHMEVRFYAATSLAYLGDGTSAQVLSEIAQAELAFRVHALNALGVMKNDLDAETHLQGLLHATSAETRYGAFRALKTRNPLDQTIRGEMLGGQFSYHGVSSLTAPMVHMTAKKYPEIVLFGTDIFLKQPFAFEAGATIYVNGQKPGEVSVVRLITMGVDERRTVSNRLDDVIRAVVSLGGTYPDVVQLLRQADEQRVLSCRLAIDCLPESNRIYRRQDDSDSNLADANEEKPKSFWGRFNPKNIFAPNPGERSSDYIGTVNTDSRY
jgi:hypothetical protein